MHPNWTKQHQEKDYNLSNFLYLQNKDYDYDYITVLSYNSAISWLILKDIVNNWMFYHDMLFLYYKESDWELQHSYLYLWQNKSAWTEPTKGTLINLTV